MRNRKGKYLFSVGVMVVGALLSGCGGGGGSSTASAPAATAEITLSAAKVSVGGTVTLTWSSTNADSCTGADGLSGSLPLSGTRKLTPTAGGQFKYTLSCQGAGGTATQSVTLVVPLPVYGTSYENKNSIILDDPKGPGLQDVPNLVPESGEGGFSERSIAFADFQQNGTFSAITVSQIYKNVYPGNNPNKYADSPGKVYFLSKDAAGQWTDISTSLIKPTSNRYTCISPGFIEVADINGDRKPDAVIGCTGIDFILNGQYQAGPQLSLQYEVLSQPDGSYVVQALHPTPIYGHQLTVADIDGDGNLDVIATDPVGSQTVVIFWGNGDGTFRLDTTRFPADMFQQPIYGVRAIPSNGQINVVVSGFSAASLPPPVTNGYGTKILQYSGGTFNYVNDLTAGIPLVTASGRQYGLALDAVLSGGSYYFLRTSNDYASAAVVKTNPATGQSSILNEVQPGTSAGPGGLIKIISDGSIVNQMTDCGPESTVVGSYFYYECALVVPTN